LALLATAGLLLAGRAASAPQQVKPAGEGPLPAGAVARFGNASFWHGGNIRDVALAPGARVLASVGYDGALCLWDPAGQLLRRIAIPNPKEERLLNRGTSQIGPALRFSGDGKVLALADEVLGQYLVFEVASGKELHRGPLIVVEEEVRLPARFGGLPVSRKRKTVGPFHLSHDGKLLAMRGVNDTIVVWELARNRERHRLKGHRGAIDALVFAADGTALLAGGDD
jgi:WD40 repeat protein